MKSKEVYRVDQNGIFIESVTIQPKLDENQNSIWEIPDDCIEVKIPDGLFQPIKWTGIEWISTLTPVEVEQILNNNPKPAVTNEELLRENQVLKSRLEAVEMATVSLMDFM